MTKQVWPDLAEFKIRQEYSVNATRQQSREARLPHAQWKLSQVIAVARQYTAKARLAIVQAVAWQKQ